VKLRVIILPHDGRRARNAELGPRRLAIAVAFVLAAVVSAVWLGWKLGELSARI
jgi:hypothetical protein